MAGGRGPAGGLSGNARFLAPTNGDPPVGRALRQFASAEIVDAEDCLAGRGWFERPCQSLRFATGRSPKR